MAYNTAYFSEFICDARDRRNWSQPQVHEAAGPYRQMQSWIESGEAQE
jgi:hypothetical protein